MKFVKGEIVASNINNSCLGVVKRSDTHEISVFYNLKTQIFRVTDSFLMGFEKSLKKKEIFLSKHVWKMDILILEAN